MHRIDGPNFAPGNLFTEGDPVAGTPATWVSADWANAVQEELCAVVEGAGLTLSKPSNSQVLAAIRTLIDLSVPVGTVLMGYFVTAKPGFVLPQGQLVTRAAYTRLWTYVQAEGLVITDAAWLAGQYGLFSSGDGATTFRLPRIGGRFPRVVDMGSGYDPGRTVGSLQDDQNKAHTHGLRVYSRSVDGTDDEGDDTVAAGAGFTAGFVQDSGGSEARPINIAWGAMMRV